MSGSNVSAVTNLLVTANEGFISTLGSTIASGASTVPLTSATGLANGTTFVGIIEPGQTNQQVFTGLVDTGGSQITSVKWTRGTNVGHTGGVSIVDYVTGTAINMLSKALAKEHTHDGTHGDIHPSSVTSTGAISGTTVSGTTATFTGAGSIGGNLAVTGTLAVASGTTASGSTITPANQVYTVSALAANATIAVPSFTPWDGAPLVLRIKDNATSRTLTFASGYTNISGLSLPTATTISKWTVIGAMYNLALTKWQILSVTTES